MGLCRARVRGALVRAAATAGNRTAPLAQLEPGAAVGAWGGAPPPLAFALDSTSPPGADAPAPPAWRAAPARLSPRPPRPASARVEAHAAALVGRPLSRARRRPASATSVSGKGHTAFTVFGIEARDTIRHAMPWAPAVEVEKRVGARWAAHDVAEKANFAAVAAEMREQVDADGTQKRLAAEGGRVLALPADFATGGEAACEGVVAAVVKEFGHVDCLVNNAAVQYDPALPYYFSPVSDLDLAAISNSPLSTSLAHPPTGT